jgi:steroid delta-isomerase-like uncharacterized protein
MSTEQNTEIATQFAQVWGRGSLSTIDELASPDLVVIYPVLPAPVHGPEGFKEVIRGVHAGLPDAELDIHETVAQGDRVALRWTLHGTHEGTFAGVPPTGQQVRLDGITIYRLADGKVVEERGQEDALGMLQRMGAIPTPQGGPDVG